MPDGHTYTAPASKRLRLGLSDTPYAVYFDHGEALEAQTIVAWAGLAYSPPQNPKQLAHLDMAVIDPAADRVVCLIEIEDTTDNPKTLIGDLVAPMLSSGIAIGQKADYILDETTSMIVFAHFKDENMQKAYAPRLAHIQDGIERIRRTLADGHVMFGRCILDSFVDQGELDQKLWRHVHDALSHYETLRAA